MEYIHPLSGYLQIASDLNKRFRENSQELDVQSYLELPECQEDVSIMCELVALKLSTISPRYQEVLRLWYGLDGIGRTPRDAGQEYGYGVGVPWITTLRRNALTRMWRKDLRQELKPFLPK
jgi:hypothetical protein